MLENAAGEELMAAPGVGGKIAESVVNFKQEDNR
jgi:hypothetical protein